MSELKSCPFCGSNNVSFVETEEQPLENSTQGFIYCHGCGFSSDVFHDGVIAKKHWNRRAQPANKPLTLGELREMGETDWVWLTFPELTPEESGWYRAKRTYMIYSHEHYGKTWLAYRSEPKEEQDER